MKNQFKTNDQSKYMDTWGKRKMLLLLILAISLILLGYSFYHFISRNHLLEIEAEKSSRFIEQASGPNNGWAYSDTVFALTLISIVFFLLVREVSLHRKMLEELKMQSEHFRITISSIDEGLITTCRNGGILYMNPAAERLTGWSDNEARYNPLEKIYDVVNEESGKPFENIVSRILRNKEVVASENNTLLLTKDRKKIIISNSGSPLFDSSGEISGAVLVFNDISEKKKIEIELKESEKQYRASIENLPQAVYTCDTQGFIAKAVERYDILAEATSDTIWDWDILNNKMLFNTKVTKMFGYGITEVDDVKHWRQENIHPDDLQLVMDAYNGAIENNNETIQIEYRFRCEDGRYKHIYDRAYVIYDGTHQKPVRMIGAMQDVTQAKEEEIKIAKAIIDAQEQERRFIGQELHDNVNQLLASSLLTLGEIKHNRFNQEKVVEYVELTRVHTQDALNEIRKLSHELVPATFDGATLKDIFESLLFEINVQNQFVINFQFDEKINGLVCADLQINLYRILQEQVKNILTYAKANIINLTVCCKGDIVIMRTFDNGIGFDSKKVKAGIGLNNMRRRVESFGGNFAIKSQTGKGCEIVVEVPSSKNRG